MTAYHSLAPYLAIIIALAIWLLAIRAPAVWTALMIAAACILGAMLITSLGEFY